MHGSLLTAPPYYTQIIRACTVTRPLTKVAALGNQDAAHEGARVATEGFRYFLRSVDKLASEFCAGIPDLPSKAKMATALFLSRCPSATQNSKLASLEADEEKTQDYINKLAGTILIDVALSRLDDTHEQEKVASLALTNAQYAMELLRSVF